MARVSSAGGQAGKAGLGRLSVRWAARLYLLLAVGALLAGQAPAFGQDGDRPRVLVTTLDESITPVVADHLTDTVARAEDEGYDAYVVELDTPGGLDTSMRDIIQRFLAAEVPVVVYVSPQGARAASAGSMIAMSANVAAMAPGTAIGAATPVQMGDGEVSDSDRKAINDAAAMAEALAERRGRNVEFAVDTVREGRSASASEALDLGAVDLIAGSLPELLDEIDGMRVEVAPDDRAVTLSTADAEIDEADMGFFRQVQQFLADPNLAFLFLSVGTLGLVYELANPGVSGAGIVGVVLIILALFGVAVLPVNVVGLVLLLMSAVLFVAELFAPGVGVAAAGGTATLILSGIFLFRGTPGMEVSMLVIAPVALVVGVGVIIAGRLVVRTRRAESKTTGAGLFVGKTVKVERVSGAQGKAFIEGAWWTVRPAEPEGAPLKAGEAEVVGMDGLALLIGPVTPGVTASEGADGPESESADKPADSGPVDPDEQSTDRSLTE